MYLCSDLAVVGVRRWKTVDLNSCLMCRCLWQLLLVGVVAYKSAMVFEGITLRIYTILLTMLYIIAIRL